MLPRLHREATEGDLVATDPGPEVEADEEDDTWVAEPPKVELEAELWPLWRSMMREAEPPPAADELAKLMPSVVEPPW